MSVDYYFRRFGFCGRQIPSPPPRDLGLTVVVPCFNEPDVLGCLESLWQCDRPACSVEAIVVINSPVGAGREIIAQNQKTLVDARGWIETHNDSRVAVHWLHFPNLPRKQAGVGLARKIGMDEALRRFADVGRPGGVIVCYDADCRCARNYLTAIEEHFQRQVDSPGCSIYFEHPLEGPLDARVFEAIAAYELHLRYYVQALRYAGFPHAHHTIGSCMAVRADAYRKQGGMNRRQAGEDFYFLHKIIPLGGFTDLTETTVYPSPRHSERVPFGTGKAIGSYLHSQRLATYPIEVFLDLKALFDQLATVRDGITLSSPGPEAMRSFLQHEGFEEVISEIRANTSTEASFRKRFFCWFDGFRVMKFIHHARDRFFGERAVVPEANKLLRRLGYEQHRSNDSPNELLAQYRRLDRQGVQ